MVRGVRVLFNRGVSSYRLAPAITGRLVGAGVVLLALATLLATVLTSLLAWPIAAVWLVAALGGLLVGGLGWYLHRLPVVRLSDAGYQVRLLRGAGVNRARWADVEDAVSATVSGAVCLVLRLRDGRSTVIPVAALAAERDAFAEDVRTHLAMGHGLRPSSRS